MLLILRENINSLIALFAIALAWFTFRFSLYIIKKSLLATLNEELDLVGRWIGTSYDENINKKEWYSPLSMVIALNKQQSVQSFLSNIYSRLLDKNLLIHLTSLNQGLGRFNQNLERHLNFIIANPLTIRVYNEVKKDLEDSNMTQNDIYCKIQKSKQENQPYSRETAYYLEFLYRLAKNIHVDGIGIDTYYNDSTDEKKFPTPHKSFLLAKMALEKEKNRKYFSWKNKWFFGDLIVVLSLLVFFLILYV